jgi:predicted molibdopterin-dependent oxidoreductase YjgC
MVIIRKDFRVLAVGGLMFKRINSMDKQTVTITIEDREAVVPASDTVGAAMLAAGFEYTRTTAVSGVHRAPYCMMGACFECLVEIDGIPNQQACQTQVREGMVVNLQKGARGIDP